MILQEDISFSFQFRFTSFLKKSNANEKHQWVHHLQYKPSNDKNNTIKCL